MKSFCLLLLLVFASVLLSGCGILGHNIARLRNVIPNLSNLGNVLRLGNEGGASNPVRIEDGKFQYPGPIE